MDKIMQTNTHAPCGYMGMLGCSGYGNTSNVICMTASGDNHFLNFGIVEGSLLFVDTGKAYTKGVLNVFKYNVLYCHSKFKEIIRKQCLDQLG